MNIGRCDDRHPLRSAEARVVDCVRLGAMRRSPGLALGLATALAFALAFPIAPNARTLRDIDGPANYPPPSYKGRQFVDNKGCVFIRAGYGNKITWVPRVDRRGNLVCNYKPTFGQSPARVASTPEKRKAPAPRQAPAPARKAAPQQTRPVANQATEAARLAATSATGKRIRLVCPEGWVLEADRKCHLAKSRPAAPDRRASKTGSRPPGNTSGINSARKTASNLRLACLPGWELREDRKCHRLPARHATARAQAANAAAPASGTARSLRKPLPSDLPADQYLALYLKPGPGLRVRPWPQDASGQRGKAAGTSSSGKVLSLAAKKPRRSLRRPNGAYTVALPKGYKPEIPLDRFNPWRAVGTDAGDAAMARIWTDELPRRLRPEVYEAPITTVSSRSKARRAVPVPEASARLAVRRIPARSPNEGSRIAMPDTAQPVGEEVLPPYPPIAEPQLRLALALDGLNVRNDASPALFLPLAEPVRIQLATFADPGRAESAKARFAALGLPAELRHFERGGRVFISVIIGPFMGDAAKREAMAMAHREGFDGAFFLN